VHDRSSASCRPSACASTRRPPALSLPGPSACGRRRHRVRISPELVEWALRTAPSGVDIYDRRGDRPFALGEGGAPRFASARPALGRRDLPLLPGPDTTGRAVHPAPHARDGRLGSALPSFDVISTIGVVQDVDPALSDWSPRSRWPPTPTAPGAPGSDERRFRVLDCWRPWMATRGAPSVLPYVNPLTPWS